MSGQVPEKKKIDWGFWGTIVLSIIVVSLFVGGLVWILTTPRNDFENFGNTAGTRLEDILNWGTINSNKGYKIVNRIPNIKRYDLNSSENQYKLHNDLYQYLLLVKTENPSPSTTMSYIVPMNVAGKEVSPNQFITTDRMMRNEKEYPSFRLDDNTVLFSAPNGTGKFSYFYNDNPRSFTERVDIPLGVSSTPSPDTKYSPWFCDTRNNNRLYGTTRVPAGYILAGSEVRNRRFFERACGSDANRPNTRRRLIYHKKSNIK